LTARYMPDIVSTMAKSQHIKIELPIPTWKDALIQYVKNISQICAFILIMLTMGAVAREKDKGTAVFLLVKPVSRMNFLIAKFISSGLSILISLTGSALFTAFYTLLFFETIPLIVFLKINLIILFYLFTISSFTIFFSTISKSQILAGVCSFFIWMFFSLMTQFGTWGKFSPGYLMNQANQLISGVTGLSWQSFACAGLVVLSSLLLSIIVFRKWEP
jgi:ABC-2 type transport system permease protein